MSGLVHIVKQGDTDPPCRAILKDALGKVVTITGSDSVTFRMTPQIKGLRADISKPAQVNDGTKGDVQGVFLVADTATPGLYNAEFRVVFADGRSKTFPTDGYITVEIEPRAAAS